MSFPTRERGLKLAKYTDELPDTDVVPHAGTWIEIFSPIACASALWSFPTRERGLKLSSVVSAPAPPVVVPHAGTWIEIYIPTPLFPVQPVVPHAGTWIEI